MDYYYLMGYTAIAGALFHKKPGTDIKFYLYNSVDGTNVELVTFVTMMKREDEQIAVVSQVDEDDVTRYWHFTLIGTKKNGKSHRQIWETGMNVKSLANTRPPSGS